MKNAFNMDRQGIEKLIEEKVKRIIGQYNVLPDSIKQRHVGEGVRYIRSGVASDRPTSGEKTGAVWFSTDSDTLNIWNGTAWVQEILT